MNRYYLEVEKLRDKGEEFLAQPRWAVVGASDKPEKFGYKIYKTMKEYRETYPVNPSIEEIEGDKCYASLAELPVKPDVVDIVVPPRVTEEVVKQCKELGITRVWIQPGAESDNAIKFCEENGIDCVYRRCAMAEIRGQRHEF